MTTRIRYNPTGYKGIHIFNGRYKAYCNKIYIGLFKTLEEATEKRKLFLEGKYEPVKIYKRIEYDYTVFTFNDENEYRNKVIQIILERGASLIYQQGMKETFNREFCVDLKHYKKVKELLKDRTDFIYYIITYGL